MEPEKVGTFKPGCCCQLEGEPVDAQETIYYHHHTKAVDRKLEVEMNKKV